MIRAASSLSTDKNTPPTISIETNDRIIFVKETNGSGLVVTRSLSNQ